MKLVNHLQDGFLYSWCWTFQFCYTEIPLVAYSGGIVGSSCRQIWSIRDKSLRFMAALRQLTTAVSQCYLSDGVGVFQVPDVLNSGSQWPRGLRSGSVTVPLLGSQVRIPRGHKSCVFWLLFVVKWTSFLRDDSSSTGVLPSVCSLSVIWCNNNILHIQWVGKSGQTKEEKCYKYSCSLLILINCCNYVLWLCCNYKASLRKVHP